MSKWTPIYERDGKRFVIPTADQVGDTKDEAFKIACGTQIVEGVLYRFSPTDDYLELRDDGTATIKGWNARLGPLDVAILDTEEKEEA